MTAGNTSVEVTAHNAGGSTRRTIRVTVAAAAPRAVGTFAPVSLSVGGAAVDVDLAHAFTPAGVPVEARSRNTGVVAALVNGRVVTLTPVGPGNASVEVTARNASGFATLSISVSVAAATPQAVGTVAPVSLTAGGAAVDVDVAAAFTPAGVPIEARSLNPGVVNATVNGSVVTLTPVGPGNTSVEVTARNASGSATLSIAVAVAAAAPTAPVAVGTLAPISLTVGGTAVEVDVAAAFTPAGVPIEARSLNTGVVNGDGERKRRHPHPGGRRQHLGRGHRAQRDRVCDPLDCGHRDPSSGAPGAGRVFDDPLGRRRSCPETGRAAPLHTGGCSAGGSPRQYGSRDG